MKTIPDEEIQAAAPEEIIEVFSPWVYKITNKYRNILEYMPAYDLEDIQQAGKMALLQAQKTYNPGKGTFISWSAGYIKHAIRSTLLLWKDTSRPETPLLSLDAEASKDTEDISLLDTVPDETTPTTEEQATDNAYKEEVSKGVRDAVERLKNDNQREAVTRIYLDGQNTQQVAEEMGLTEEQIRNQTRAARDQLRRDYVLKQIADEYYYIHVGLHAFKTNGYSSVELALLKIEAKYNHIFGAGAFLSKEEDETATGRNDNQW